MGFLRCFFSRLNSISNFDWGCFSSRWRICDRLHRRQRPLRSTPVIVDLRHPPDAAVASAVAFASASKPPPFTSFVKKIIRFSRGSRGESAGGELARECREGQAQGPEIELQTTAQKSREGVEEAETAHWSAIEVQSGEKIMEGGFEGELHEETQELSGRDVIEEAKSAGEACEPCICDASRELSGMDVIEEGKSAGEACEPCICDASRELSGRDGNEEIDIVEDSLRAEISGSIGTLGVLLKEAETISSPGAQLEEGEIIDSPRAEVEEGETRAEVEEGDTGLEEGEIVDSPRAEVEEGEIVDSPRAEVEEWEIVDSPRAEVEEGEIVDSPRAEVKEWEMVDSPCAEGSPPLFEQIADCMKQSRELLEKSTSSDAAKVLEIISKALSISMLSERMMEMKAEALLMLHCYEDVIQMFEHTLDSSEKNSVTTDMKDEKSCETQKISLEKLWRLHLMAKAYFYMGKFEEAMELLQKHEEVKPGAYMSGNMLTESSKSLSVKITKLLGFRAVGNEAFQSKRFSEAVEHYTAALAFSMESRPFSATCFYSRAIANQELGKVMDAIADCSLAIVLDQRYVEAISRRATLHELIRDYEQAANDLKMLISILENQKNGQGHLFGISKGLYKRQGVLEQARLRLCTLEEQARKGTRKDIYMILGVERNSSMTDVKNAYRRAALKHHPDKSGLLLIKSENVNDGLWREVVDQVQADADKLFKLIGEAYNVLSDASKRQKYKEEEDEEERVRMWSSNRSAGYEQRRNPYDFSQGYEQRRNYYRSNTSNFNSSSPRTSTGYEERRNDFNRGGQCSGNERCEQRNNANDFNQGCDQRTNTSYFNKSDARTSTGRSGYDFKKDYEQRRNGPDFTRGCGHRSNASNFYRRYPHFSRRYPHFYRRYPHFNYEDLYEQYDQPEQWW